MKTTFINNKIIPIYKKNKRALIQINMIAFLFHASINENSGHNK